jgi:hypothetical protein
MSACFATSIHIHQRSYLLADEKNVENALQRAHQGCERATKEDRSSSRRGSRPNTPPKTDATASLAHLCTHRAWVLRIVAGTSEGKASRLSSRRVLYAPRTTGPYHVRPSQTTPRSAPCFRSQRMLATPSTRFGRPWNSSIMFLNL